MFRATAKLRHAFCAATWLLIGLLSAPAQGPSLPAGTRFIMSHFGSDNGGGIEKLFISVSPDGVNWEALNGGNAVWQPAGWFPFHNVVRDPSIVFANGWYWVAYTSGNYGKHASFGLVKSQDLLNWTFVGEISTAIPGATDPLTWGPFFFKDGDGSVHVFVSISPINGSDYNPVPAMRTHELHPLNADFTQWSAPVQVALPGTNTNEFWVWREGDTYHGIYVDFGRGGQYFHTTSANLITGWQPARALGFGSLEGGFVLKKPGGGYRLYLEPGNVGEFLGYRFYDCSDDFTGFAGPVYTNAQTPARNGKVIAAPFTTTFAQWQSAELGTLPAAQRAPLADPDQDGLPNLVECGIGSPPQVPDARTLETWIDSANRQRLRHRRASSIVSLGASLETTAAIPDWQPAGSAFQIRSVTLMSDGHELVEWASSAGVEGERKLTRLRISDAP
jgi:hypothetical protein